jgi:hypothetical protein
MKKLSFLGLVVGMIFVNATLVKSQSVAVEHMPFIIDFQSLSKYLELSAF